MRSDDVKLDSITVKFSSVDMRSDKTIDLNVSLYYGPYMFFADRQLRLAPLNRSCFEFVY